MDGADLWAMLAPHGAQTIIAPRGYGSLTSTDLMHMLKGLPRGPMLMGLVFDAGFVSSLRDLEIYLWGRINERAAQGGWQYHKKIEGEPAKPFDRKLARLIIIEIAQRNGGKDLRGGKPCENCGGVGYTLQDAQPLPCDCCCGTGRQKLTATDRATYCCMSRVNWQRTWSSRYEAMHSMANAWLGEARTHLRGAVNKFSQCG